MTHSGGKATGGIRLGDAIGVLRTRSVPEKFRENDARHSPLFAGLRGGSRRRANDADTVRPAHRRGSTVALGTSRGVGDRACSDADRPRRRPEGTRGHRIRRLRRRALVLPHGRAAGAGRGREVDAVPRQRARAGEAGEHAGERGRLRGRGPRSVVAQTPRVARAGMLPLGGRLRGRGDVLSPARRRRRR